MEKDVTLKKNIKIKLMFVIDFIYDITGGTENQIVKLINNLDTGKYELYMLSLRNTPWITDNKIKLKCNVASFNYNIFNHKDPFNFIVLFQAFKHIKMIAPDIVMTLFPTSNTLGVIAAKIAKVKVIISTRRDYGLWLKNKAIIYLLRFANKFLKMIIANSSTVKSLVSDKEGFDNSRIAVIYNGIDSDNFKRDTNRGQSLKDKLGIPSHNKVIGIIANLRPMKRHHTFINAAKNVLKFRTDVSFVIVGSGSLKDNLVDLASECGIAEHLYFVGSHKDTVPFLSFFDIGVNCSANEGLSNAIMEYMAAGIPCIVSHAGGNPELIQHGINGYTFELDNYEELAKLILSLLNDKEKQESFSGQSKNKIKTMSVDKMISQYDTTFTTLFNDVFGFLNQ